MTTELNIEDRRARETELIAIKGFMAMAELAQNLEVSESTVRRDLEILEEQGIVRRTHGGAIYVKSTPGLSVVYAERETAAAAEKQAIAKAVAAMIPEGQTIILGGGTTCYQVARAIAGRHINVITNSVQAAGLLLTEFATEVTLIGGYLYPRIGVALGATAAAQIENLRAGQLILSCAGLTEDGAYNANQMIVDVEQKMMQVADEVILIADHTKLGMRSVVKLCSPSSINTIVTDAAAGPEARRWLEAMNRKVVYAG
ncbi:MAG: DeoR/GlpR transcriptional regulator [Planctomycetes bacterium]|nr:DeoR/GlpR transcriptional regulator [Planctomycetota bacterium]